MPWVRKAGPGKRAGDDADRRRRSAEGAVRRGAPLEETEDGSWLTIRRGCGADCWGAGHAGDVSCSQCSTWNGVHWPPTAYRCVTCVEAPLRSCQMKPVARAAARLKAERACVDAGTSPSPALPAPPEPLEPRRAATARGPERPTARRRRAHSNSRRQESPRERATTRSRVEPAAGGIARLAVARRTPTGRHGTRGPRRNERRKPVNVGQAQDARVAELGIPSRSTRTPGS